MGSEMCIRDRLDGMRNAAAKHGIPFTASHAGGMFGFFFTDVPKVSTFQEVMGCNGDHFKAFFHHMLDANVYLAPSAFEAGFISAAHSPEHIEQTISAAESAFAKLAG